MSNFEDEEDDFAFSYGDINRTTFAIRRPGKEATFEDDFNQRLYYQAKAVIQAEGRDSIFPQSMVQKSIQFLQSHIYLQKTVNAAAFVLGMEYYQNVISRQPTESLLDIFSRGLKCSNTSSGREKEAERKIQPFDIIRYNRIIWSILHGDQSLQPTSVRFKQIKTDSREIRLLPDLSSSESCPSFQTQIPSKDPNEEGICTILIEEVPHQISEETISVYQFDTLETLLERYCLQRADPLPIEYIIYDIEYNQSEYISSGVKTYTLSNRQTVAVQIEEEKTSTHNSLDKSIIRIYPITQITLDDSLTLKETLSNIQTQFIDSIVSAKNNLQNESILAVSSAYFICFGLLDSNQLFQIDKYPHELIWTQFLREHSISGSIWSDIKVDERTPRLQELKKKKNELQQLPHLVYSEEFKKVLRELEILQSQVLSKSVFFKVRDLIINQFTQLQERVQRHTVSSRQMAYLLSLSSPFRFTSMKETNYTLEGTFRLEGYDTYQIFDEMKVSYEIPFCSVGKFHKVLNDIVLPKQWLVDQETEDIIFYIRTNVSKSLYSITQSNMIDSSIYTKVFFSLEKSELLLIDGKETYMSTFRVTIEAAYSVELDDVLQKFLSSFTSPPMNLSVRKLFGKGEYVMTGFTFSEEVLQDYVFNDPLVREFVSIDEKFVIYKERGGIKFKLGGGINGSLKYKIIEKNTDIEAKMFPGEIKVNDTVYRISIEREARSGIISIRDVLERKQYFDKCLLYIFNTHVSRFFAWYCRHISNISDLFYVKEVERKQKIYHMDPKTRLQQLNPLLFRVGYTSGGGCDIGKLPYVISEEEAEKTIHKFKFPKDIDVTEERPQFWYTCPMGNYSYPSLNINRVKIRKNKKEEEAYHKLYPFIPCCAEQKGYEGTLIYNYEEDPNNTLDTPIIPRQKDTSRSKTILLEKTPIGIRRLAKLPKSIEDLLAITLESALIEEQQFVRLGIPISKKGNSLLTACCMALVFQHKLRDEDLVQALQTKENEYTNKLLDILPKQLHSQCKKSVEEMTSILQSEQFMNPRDWIQILQIVFEMNIVVFYYDTEDQQEGIQMYPVEYERFLLLRQDTISPYSKTLFLYNTPSKRAYEQRHTELIVLVSTSGPKVLQTSFLTNPDGPISIQQAITNTQLSYPIPISKYCRPVYQLPDAYGKIRELHFELQSRLPAYRSTDMYYLRILCSPIAPLPLSSIKSIHSFNQDPLLILELFKLLQLTPYTLSDPSNTNYIGLVGIHQSVEYYGLFEKPISIDYSNQKGYSAKKWVNMFQELQPYNMKIYGNRGYPFPVHDIKSQDTFFQKYSRFTREANCILNYTYYLFSFLYHEEFDLLSILTNFIEEHTEIRDQEHTYTIETRSFQMENSFIQKRKLILTSQTLLDRILYNLKMQIEYNEFALRKFHLRKYIPNYYNNAKDFTSQDDYTIYFTIQEYNKSREKQKIIYRVYSSAVPQKAFYFQHSELFQGELCIATILLDDKHKMNIFKIQQPFWYFSGNTWNTIQFVTTEIGLEMRTSSLIPDKMTPALLLYASDQNEFLYFQVRPVKSLSEFDFLRELYLK
jgi:hypothetical protein